MLRAAERKTLEAVCEALLPSMSAPEGGDPELFRLSATEIGVADVIEQAFETALTKRQAAQLQLFLSFLTLNYLSPFMFTGIPVKFYNLTLRERQVALRRMSKHPLPMIRSGFQALRRLATFLFYSIVPESGGNPTWPSLRYSPPPPRTAGSTGAALTLTRITQPTSLDADVCIVGSGAGGGVVAAKLAETGKKVVVLEAGSGDQAADYDHREAIAMRQLYLNQGTTSTKDAAVSILAGSAIGGGTAINWQTCLRTPDHVRDEWAERSGLGVFTDDAFTRALGEVAQRLSVGTGESVRNANNEALARGCSSLGYSWDETARNARGCDQSECGFCAFGCRRGGKRSTANTYLRDAQAAGDVTIVPECRAERVIIESGRVNGVVAVAPDGKGGMHAVTVRAKTVVVAAGAIETPALLLRSRVEHAELGRNLFLHPTTAVAGRYVERINGWLGAPQTVVCKQFAKLYGAYGYHLETAPVHPGLIAMALPWTDPATHRRTMQDAANVSAFIVLTRDRDGGRVQLDRQGRAMIDYPIRAPERALLQHGIATAARIHWAAGAAEVLTIHTEPQILRRSASADIDAFAQRVQQRPVHGNRCGVFSAHQMGTCRMGANPSRSVTDERGAVNGVRGLYVSDASLFPLSSGVNPMITVMAIATIVGEHLAGAA